MNMKGGGGDPQVQKAFLKAKERERFHITTTGRKAQAIRRWLDNEEMYPAELIYIIADWALRMGWERKDPMNPNKERDQVEALQARDWLSFAAWLRYEMVPGAIMRQPPPLMSVKDENGERFVYQAPPIRDGFLKQLIGDTEDQEQHPPEGKMKR